MYFNLYRHWNILNTKDYFNICKTNLSKAKSLNVEHIPKRDKSSERRKNCAFIIRNGDHPRRTPK